MIDDVYNSKILGFAGNISRIGRIEVPDASAKAHSKLCGSTIVVDIKMQGDEIADYAHDVKACALGQASSAIVAANILGASSDEMRQVRLKMLQMLKEDGPVPEGRFADLKYLQPVKNHKARHASTLLVFDAVVDALAQIEISSNEVADQESARGATLLASERQRKAEQQA
jgi:NifU-like protein involved in Fe-S cluster formation